MSSRWWSKDRDEISAAVFEYVGEVERHQAYLFDRFYKLGCLYDPYFEYLSGWGGLGDRRSQFDSVVSENVIASNVDTVTAVVAATEVRARFITDDGDWSQQRRARHLELYAEGLQKTLSVQEAATAAFKECALKGTGLVKVFADMRLGKIRIEPVVVDDIIVDEAESRRGKPRQMHQRVIVDREELRSEYGDKVDQITDSDGANTGRLWAGYRPYHDNQVVLIESWRLPYGTKGDEHYQPGRHTICADGICLVYEEWHSPKFPFAVMVWSDRPSGWYGIGGAERVAGHQRQINKRNWQIDRQLDQMAVPTTYVRPADANLRIRTTNRVGTVVPVKGDYPHTVIPPSVSAEVFKRQDDNKASSYEEFGMARMNATGHKPAGLDSGAALREYRDQTTQRFAQQEKRFERLVLDIVILALGAAKELGDKAPIILFGGYRGKRKLKLSEVNMDEAEVIISAASTLSRTPAGRMQTVLEWAQAGVISQDEARRLMRMPDLEGAMSLYTAALESIERAIEAMFDGDDDVVPEPYQNLEMNVWRTQQAYLKAQLDGAPDDVLERLQRFVSQSAWMISKQQMSQPTMDPAMVDPMAGGVDPMAPVPGAPMPTSTPQAALAPEAMNLVAG